MTKAKITEEATEELTAAEQSAADKAEAAAARHAEAQAEQDKRDCRGPGTRSSRC